MAHHTAVSLARRLLTTIGACFVASLTMLSSPAAADGQSTYSWNDTGSSWSLFSDWSSIAGSGGSFPGSADIAEFTGGVFSTTINPILSADTTISQLRFTGSPTDGWLLSGSNTLTTGSATVSGIVTSGAGNYTIDVGNGSGISLLLNGPSSPSAGAMIIGSGSLTLTGNTIASAGSTNITIRSGTLILDNSPGNPTLQRLTTSGALDLYGGGSTIEFRGASGGTTFNGFTGQFAAAGAGDTYIRTVQNGAATLAISFKTLGRTNTSGSLIVENIGSGFVGDSGKPSLTFTFAIPPTTSQNILSTSSGTPIPWVAVTNRPSLANANVTARWANYSGGVVASNPTPYAGDFSGTGSAGTNVLFNPTTPGLVTLGTAGTQIASVVLEPSMSGVSLDVGAGINTYGLMVSNSASMVSATIDISVIGSNLFSTTAAAKTILVLSSNASLSTIASLNITNSSTTSSPVTIGGNGFVILTGNSNQIGTNTWSTTAFLNLGGGVLRGNSSNLIFDAGTGAGVRLNLRGGVLEYDVTNLSATFSMSVGKLAKQVSWTDIAGFGATTNAGGGGFSAYSTNPNNTLTVNIGGIGSTLYWNDSTQLFITDGYALKFGSVRSNATVVWQNPIALDGNSDLSSTNTITSNRAREINVTLGAGNTADQTQLKGAITGSANTDLVKTGTGVLELTANNTYAGRTFVNGGELRVFGQTSTNSGTGIGAVVVGNGGTLGGNGQALSPVSILGGGSIRGGDGTGANQVLTTGNLTLYSNSAIRAVIANGIGVGTANIDTSVTGASLISIRTGSTFGRSTSSDSIGIVLTSDGSLNLDGSTTFTRRLASYPGLASNLTVGSYTSSTSDFTVTGSNFSIAPGWSVLVSPGALDVTFAAAPVPEPAHVLLVCGLIIGVGGVIRRRVLAAAR